MLKPNATALKAFETRTFLILSQRLMLLRHRLEYSSQDLIFKASLLEQNSLAAERIN